MIIAQGTRRNTIFWGRTKAVSIVANVINPEYLLKYTMLDNPKDGNLVLVNYQHGRLWCILLIRFQKQP